MIPDAYVWLAWSGAFLLPWLILFRSFPRYRKTMIRVSVFTMPFGLTEPLFVPRYWNPSSNAHQDARGAASSEWCAATGRSNFDFAFSIETR